MEKEGKNIWLKCLSLIQKQVLPEKFKTLFEPIRAVRFKDDVSKSRDPCGSSRRGRARDRAYTRQAADSHRHAHLAGVASVHIGPAAGSRRDDVGRNT